MTRIRNEIVATVALAIVLFLVLVAIQHHQLTP